MQVLVVRRRCLAALVSCARHAESLCKAVGAMQVPPGVKIAAAFLASLGLLLKVWFYSAPLNLAAPAASFVSGTTVSWESTEIDRFQNLSFFHHGFGPRPVYWDRSNMERRVGWKHAWAKELTRTSAIDHDLGRTARINIAYDRSLGALRHPSTTLPGARRIYIDLGARNPTGPKASIEYFQREYPGGSTFYVYAFEADKRFKPMYKGLPNTTYIEAAVATFDGDCFFSKDSSVKSSMSMTQRGNDVATKCVDLVKWLHHHVKPTDLVVMKMDVEKAEFELVAELLKSPKTARLIDELMLECHHAETYDLPPATYRDCLEMFRSLQAAGIWTHEWF